jgi:Calcium-dependent channel, 7TM region, putative phosphate/Late exocytosis, associated with Golgi transport/Cytosolic domain of 10TM putative phosphate transporter
MKQQQQRTVALLALLLVLDAYALRLVVAATVEEATATTRIFDDDDDKNASAVPGFLSLAEHNFDVSFAAAAAAAAAATNDTMAVVIPEWVYQFQATRQRIFLATIEPIVVALFGPVVEAGDDEGVVEEEFLFADNATTNPFNSLLNPYGDAVTDPSRQLLYSHSDGDQRRRLLSWPGWQAFLSNSTHTMASQKEANFSFATLFMLFVTLNCVFLIFLSCFYHNQKTSPLFISPRRHRLPKLVPPPLPLDGYFSWVKVCLFISDEEIINRVGYDSLIFIRFHRLALRCIVKMSIFSFIVLLPLNFTGNPSSGNLADQDIREMMFFTNFMLFSMANIGRGSPRLWVHCFAAYLLTGIVIRELLIEYETFNSIRHRYLLSREPHLRTVLVTNIPRHLRSSRKISSYFRHVYPNAVHSVFICQNLIRLEALIRERTAVLARIEKELLLLCRSEKRKLYEQGFYAKCRASVRRRLEDEPCCYCLEGPQERLAKLYSSLDDLNAAVEAEQTRRRKVMRMLDHMEAGEGASAIDYVLASPFIDGKDARQRRVLGLASATSVGSTSQPPPPPPPAAGPYHPLGVKTYSAQEMPSMDPEMGGKTHQSERPEAIPEGNEDDEDGVRASKMPSDPPVTSFDENQSVMSVSQLRSRSPATSTVSLAQAETAQDTIRTSSTGAGAPTTSQPATRTAAFSARPTVAFDDDGRHRDDDANEGVIKENAPTRGMRRGLRSFAKAKQAIRRYGRFNKQRVSFLGRPIHQRSEDVPPPVQGHIEDHINEVTDKAFVVMRTFTAATIAIQSMHSSKPGSMQVSTAPEPRDILWKNIYVSKGAHRTRSFLGEGLVLIIILFYAFPVTLISLLTSDAALKTMSPRLSQLAQASSFFSAAIALVQPLCIVGLQQLLPPLFIFIGEAEGILSFSEVQMRAFSRYFLFQVINVFLVTTISTSIFDTIAMIIESPEYAFRSLGSSLPKLSSFFITFITIKTFLALGFELVRTMSLVQAVLRYFIFPNATLRTQRTVMMGMRAIDDPGWFPFHKILAQDMLVVVVSVVFAVVAPLVLLPCAIFCLYSRIMWTHHHLYVLVPR